MVAYSGLCLTHKHRLQVYRVLRGNTYHVFGREIVRTGATTLLHFSVPQRSQRKVAALNPETVRTRFNARNARETCGTYRVKRRRRWRRQPGRKFSEVVHVHTTNIACLWVDLLRCVCVWRRSVMCGKSFRVHVSSFIASFIASTIIHTCVISVSMMYYI